MPSTRSQQNLLKYRIPLPTDANTYGSEQLPQLGALVSTIGPLPRKKPHAHSLSIDEILPVINVAHLRESSIAAQRRYIYDHELVIVLSGDGHAHIGDQSIVYTSGSIFLIPPFVQHQIVAYEHAQACHIAIHFDWNDQLPPLQQTRSAYRIAYAEQLNFPINCGQAEGQHVTALQNIIIKHHHSEEQQRYLARLQFAQFLLQLDQSQSSPTLPQTIQLVLKHISAEPQAGWSSERLAAIAGLSPSRFTAIFGQHIGQSPMRYVRAVRMEHACSLLSSSNDSITTIAEACGFSDPYHFSRVFHKHYGRSPSEWRKAYASGSITLSL